MLSWTPSFENLPQVIILNNPKNEDCGVQLTASSSMQNISFSTLLRRIFNRFREKSGQSVS